MSVQCRQATYGANRLAAEPDGKIVRSDVSIAQKII